MARHCKRFCLLFAAAWLLGGHAVAHAYEEQASLDMALGYASLVGSDYRLRQGAAAELGAGVGVSEHVVLRGNVGYATLVGRDDIQPTGRLRIEALYLLDVLQVVPFFGLGATVTTADDSAARVPLRAGGHLLLGVDYLLSRSWVFGVDLRSALLAEGPHLRSATDLSLRLSRMFETF